VRTDPSSVRSACNSEARPAPFDDLFYTQNVFGPAWSPHGQEIRFTTDMSIRFNLWKVRSSGGWPIQPTQSDDRQYSAVWFPEGRWIVDQQGMAPPYREQANRNNEKKEPWLFTAAHPKVSERRMLLG
jgi:hypothetical protein